MSDPIPAPDDDLAATRARIAAQGDAFDFALLALGEVAQERDRLKACLAEWQAVRNVLTQAEDPDDVARIIQRLQAVAEAAKALAKAEGWMVSSGYDGEEGDHTTLLAVAHALLALGPEWDWRIK